uniref:Mitochondrial zinc maintenance protein 1, mitochondrial n=1 Tax=Haptolina brevifila TaxID=156173 RepID=A0A6U7F7B5_9EUKA|mmetsp:Transcript_40564/g.81372  ORF Transcript_40564/g.81372 Transcript_40564/m.81372 type:complete len:130 (+) Transcript_40564:54-443(+)
MSGLLCATRRLHTQPLVRHGSSAINAYRELLKAQRSLFDRDPDARTAARDETRQHFLANAAVAPEEAAALAADALDTAGFLRQNVAQAELNDRGNYELRVTKEHIREGSAQPPLPGCTESLNVPTRPAS